VKQRLLRAWLAVFFAMSIPAYATPRFEPRPEQVLQSLSERSGRAPQELQQFLADCDADQQAMYFCAYRDVVAADLRLQHAAAARDARFPRCAADLSKLLREREAKRNRGCEASNARSRADRSLAPTPVLLCVRHDIDTTAKRVESLPPCAQ
jgi:hypothetical protein